jgi:hypothetical protein
MATGSSARKALANQFMQTSPPSTRIVAGAVKPSGHLAPKGRTSDWLRAGGFDSRDPFHSTSFFVEALGRSSLIDPSGATPERVQCLRRAAHWLMASPAAEKGIISNRPYTHRRYILAAALGQAGRVTGEQDSTHRAAKWADEGPPGARRHEP